MIRSMIKRWRSGLADVWRFRVRPIRPAPGTNPGVATGASIAPALPLDTLILDHVNDAVIATDPELRILSWNRAAEAIYGWRAVEVLGKAVPEIIPVNSYLDGSDRETVLAELRRDSFWKGEVVQRHRDGRELVIEASSRVIRDTRGRIVALVSVNRDITERTRAADALYLSEASFRTAFDYATAGIAIVAPDGRYVRVNPAYTDILGYTSEELQTTTYQAITPEEDIDTSLSYAQRLLAGELSSYQLEKRYLHKRGHPVWVLLSVSLVRDARGGPQYFISQIQDISERKRAEQELRESEERLRRLAEASFEGILLHHDGIILDANDNLARMFGYERDEVIGMPALSLAAPESRAAIEESMRTGNEQPYEAVGLRKDGSTFPGEIHAKAAPYHGTMIRVAAIRDLTLRKQAEEERLAFERKLQETQKLESLGVLTRGIAHDFNNLLAIVLGNASLVLMQLPPDTPLKPTLDGIVTAARHGGDLSRQMLAYAGKGSPVRERVDLNETIHEISELVAASMHKQITLEYALAPTLPAIEGDRSQLRQVVMNLIINAAEAIGEREGRIIIATAVTRWEGGDDASEVDAKLKDRGYVCLTVTDTGCGMDCETQSRIFEPFFSTKFIGRGLGLAAVAGIVRRHDGGVMVASTPGAGTTFTVRLPTVDAAEPPSHQERQDRQKEWAAG